MALKRKRSSKSKSKSTSSGGPEPGTLQCGAGATAFTSFGQAQPLVLEGLAAGSTAEGKALPDGRLEVKLTKVTAVTDKAQALELKTQDAKTELAKRREDLAALQEDLKELRARVEQDLDDDEAPTLVVENMRLQGMHKRGIKKLLRTEQVTLALVSKATMRVIVLRPGVRTHVAGVAQPLVWCVEEEEAEEKVEA